MQIIISVIIMLLKISTICVIFIILLSYSMLGMYTLLSMDTYPSIMKNIVIDSPYNLIFFIPFVAINLFFLLFIPVAVIFENYKNQRAIIMIKEELLIKKALTYSFICISHPNNDNYISKD